MSRKWNKTGEAVPQASRRQCTESKVPIYGVDMSFGLRSSGARGGDFLETSHLRHQQPRHVITDAVDRAHKTSPSES